VEVLGRKGRILNVVGWRYRITEGWGIEKVKRNMIKPKVVLLIFVSGKIVLTGAKVGTIR
jgi:hypothetical protein